MYSKPPSEPASLSDHQLGLPPDPGTLRVDTIGVLLLLATGKKTILQSALACAAIALVTVFILPSIYVATTKMMPPQQTPSLATLMQGQLGSLANLSAGKDLGLKNPSDVYVTMLQSRTINRALIQRYNLIQVYGAKRMEDAEEDLRDATQITVGKDGVITVSVEDEDPKRAADIANDYVAELRKLSQTLSANEAQQRREFFQKQLDLARDELTKAEVQLRNTQEKTGLLEISTQGKLIIESVARLQAQIRAREVQLKSMQSFASPQNPDLMRLQGEVRELRAQLAKLEKNSGGEPGSTQIPAGKMPETGLEYLRNLREVNYYEIIFELLAKQYEAAKIDEARTSATIQVLDAALVPEKRSRPKRLTLIILAGLLGAIGAIFYLLARDGIERMNQDPDTFVKIRKLRDQLFARS